MKMHLVFVLQLFVGKDHRIFFCAICIKNISAHHTYFFPSHFSFVTIPLFPITRTDSLRHWRRFHYSGKH